MAENIRGYDFSFLKGHPKENILNDVVDNVFKQEPNKVVDMIKLYKQPLSVMRQTGHLSPEDYSTFTGHMTDYESKINQMIKHNTPTFGENAYKPQYRISVDGEGNFVRQDNGERLKESQVGRQHIENVPTKAKPESNSQIGPNPKPQPLKQMRYSQEEISKMLGMDSPKTKPETSKITVEESAAAYDKAAKAHVSTSPIQDGSPQYHTAARTGELPNFNKTDVFDTKKASRFLKANQGKIMLGALGVGVFKSMVDGEDDDMLSATGKGIKTAAFVSGTSYAAQHLMKTETVQDMVKGEISDASKKVADKVEMERKTITRGGKIGTALKIGMMVGGVATAMDIGQRMSERSEAENIKYKQQKNIEEKEKKQQKKNKEKSYGHIDDGEILFDLFNARTGHHKMGNAKFN